jgi:hypothetical protein
MTAVRRKRERREKLNSRFTAREEEGTLAVCLDSWELLLLRHRKRGFETWTQGIIQLGKSSLFGRELIHRKRVGTVLAHFWLRRMFSWEQQKAVLRDRVSAEEEYLSSA